MYGQKVESLKLIIDFKYIDTFGYLSFFYGNIEKTHPYSGFYEPIEKEIKLENILSDSSSDILMPTVVDSMKEVARIFGLSEFPNPLAGPNGEMVYIQGFKGRR
jgi:hypothetical protein